MSPHKAASKDDIRKDPEHFISDLPKRYRKNEMSYKKALYCQVQDCVTLAELAEEDDRYLEMIERGAYWRRARQRCPKNDYLKLAIYHMLQPNDSERSKACKWLAVVKYLVASKGEDVSIEQALRDGGGIEGVYAEATSRMTVKSLSASQKQADDNVRGDDQEDDSDDQEADEPQKDELIELEVFVSSEDFDEILSSRTAVLVLTIGGRHVPGKPKDHKRVSGCLTKP